MKICAVVVSFNRLTLLKEGVNSLLKQTRPLDKIIIVDNGSTDGTREWLEQLNNEKVEYIFQENLGGAGGMNTGVKEAFRQGFDWFWLMDDDVEAAPDCLQELLKYSEISECLHPLRKYISGEDFAWEHYYDPNRGILIPLSNISFENGKDICFVNVGCFEGMLISRNIVEKIGFPNADYFIAGDDLEYGFLASTHTNVSYTKNAKLTRKKRKEDEKASPFYAYYIVRNRHLLKKLKKKVFQKKSPLYDIIFEFYYIENILMLFKSFVFKKKGWLYFKSIIRGYIDAIREKVGNTY